MNDISCSHFWNSAPLMFESLPQWVWMPSHRICCGQWATPGTMGTLGLGRPGPLFFSSLLGPSFPPSTLLNPPKVVLLVMAQKHHSPQGLNRCEGPRRYTELRPAKAPPAMAPPGTVTIKGFFGVHHSGFPLTAGPGFCNRRK